MANKNYKTENELLIEKEFIPLIDELYKFAFGLTGNKEDARDLVQETFYRVIRSIDSYNKGTNSKAWIYTILRNSFINHYRKKMRSPQEVEYENVAKYKEGENSKGKSYFDMRNEVEGDFGDEVTMALGKLDVKYRTIILLRELSGFSYKDIAELLNLKEGTVRSRLHRARNDLKEMLYKYAKTYGIVDKRK